MKKIQDQNVLLKKKTEIKHNLETEIIFKPYIYIHSYLHKICWINLKKIFHAIRQCNILVEFNAKKVSEHIGQCVNYKNDVHLTCFCCFSRLSVSVTAFSFLYQWQNTYKMQTNGFYKHIRVIAFQIWSVLIIYDFIFKNILLNLKKKIF